LDWVLGIHDLSVIKASNLCSVLKRGALEEREDSYQFVTNLFNYLHCTFPEKGNIIHTLNENNEEAGKFAWFELSNRSTSWREIGC
jgi:hypothetical protein